MCNAWIQKFIPIATLVVDMKLILMWRIHLLHHHAISDQIGTTKTITLASRFTKQLQYWSSKKIYFFFRFLHSTSFSLGIHISSCLLPHQLITTLEPTQPMGHVVVVYSSLTISLHLLCPISVVYNLVFSPSYSLSLSPTVTSEVQYVCGCKS